MEMKENEAPGFCYFSDGSHVIASLLCSEVGSCVFCIFAFSVGSSSPNVGLLLAGV